jgi:hypothetical protein
MRDSIPSDSLRFNDPELPQHLDSLMARLDSVAKQDNVLETLVLAIKGYSRSLLAERNSLNATYAAANTSVSLCKTVQRGLNTLALYASRRDSSGTRDAGNQSLLTVVAQTRFTREPVSLRPVAFVMHSSNVPDFQIRGDTLIALPGEKNLFRLGTLLALNLASWGTQGEKGAALGLGFGTGGGGKVLSDFFVGMVVGYYDLLQIGVGAGVSQLPARVKGATPGRLLPADAGKLDDLIENDWKGALYLIFSLRDLIPRKEEK